MVKHFMPKPKMVVKVAPLKSLGNSHEREDWGTKFEESQGCKQDFFQLRKGGLTLGLLAYELFFLITYLTWHGGGLYKPHNPNCPIDM